MDQNLTLALVLIVACILLEVAELFVPSGGLLSVLGLGGLIVAVVLVFNYDTTTGFWTLGALCVAMPILMATLFHYWPKTPMGRRFFLIPPSEDANQALSQEESELEALRGQVGRALSTLRPAGVVDFNGRRIDAITEGMMVDPGQEVRCIDVKGTTVVVRPIEKPKFTDLENADFG